MSDEIKDSEDTLEKKVEKLAAALLSMSQDTIDGTQGLIEIVEVQEEHIVQLGNRLAEMESQLLHCLRWMRIQAEREANKVGTWRPAITIWEA